MIEGLRTDTSYFRNFAKGHCYRQIMILFATFFIGICFAAFVSTSLSVVFPSNHRTVILITSVIQALSAFILPAFFTGIISFGKEDYIREYNRKIFPSYIIGVILLIIMIVPFINVIIHWNEGMTLNSLPELENKLREFEKNAEAATLTMLEVDSFGAMLINVLIIGIITGLAEEIFFRGALQRILQSRLNRHASVWITAAIFSFIHFQFFGFIPRLLLGAVFGYIFLWSGSIVPSSIAHATNNSLVVIFTWLEHNGYLRDLTDSRWFTPDPGEMSVVFSIIFSLMILVILFKYRNQKLTL